MTEQNVQNDVIATGSVRKQIFNADGILIYDCTDHNLVVTVGKSFLALWLTALTQSVPFMSWVGLGTGTATPTLSDTNLQTPLPTREQGTLTAPGSTNIWQNQASFGPGVNTGSITEAGLFSASTSGTMFARQTFGVVSKGAGDTLVLTWQVTIN